MTNHGKYKIPIEISKERGYNERTSSIIIIIEIIEFISKQRAPHMRCSCVIKRDVREGKHGKSKR